MPRPASATTFLRDTIGVERELQTGPPRVSRRILFSSRRMAVCGRKIDSAVKERAVPVVSEDRGEYTSLPAYCDQVGRRLELGQETVWRLTLQADTDAGARPGVCTAESAEIERLKTVNRRLAEDLGIMRRASIVFAGELDPRYR